MPPRRASAAARGRRAPSGSGQGGGTTTATLIGGAPLQLAYMRGAKGLEVSEDGMTAYAPSDDAAFLYALDLRPCTPGGAGAGAGTRTAARAPWAAAPHVALKTLSLRLRLAAAHGAAAAAAAAAAARAGGGAATTAKHAAAALLPALGTTSGDGGRSTDRPELLVKFGSGSQAGVDDAISVVEPQAGAAATYDATTLLTALRTDGRVTGAAPLDIAAATAFGCDTKLVLFNRGSAPGGCNSFVLIELRDFYAYLFALERATEAADGSPGSKEDAAARVLAPKYSVAQLELPPLSVPPAPGGGGGGVVHYSAGVTGASSFMLWREGRRAPEDEVMLIAASYETDGGEVLGTRLAAVPLLVLLQAAMSGRLNGPVPSINLYDTSAMVTAPADGQAGGGGGGSSSARAGGAPLTAKLEGVAVRRAMTGPRDGAPSEVDVLALTKPGGGAAQLLQIRFRTTYSLSSVFTLPR